MGTQNASVLKDCRIDLVSSTIRKSCPAQDLLRVGARPSAVRDVATRQGGREED